MRESGKSKGQRLFLFGFAAVLLVFVIVPASASLGSMVAAPFSADTVLQAQSGVTSVWTNSTHEVPFASVYGGAEFTAPAGATVYIVTNVTVEEAQARNVNQFIVTTNYGHKGNASWGLGSSASDFTPYETLDQNLSSVSFPIATQFLTGNQSAHFIVELQSPATSYTVSFVAKGNSGLSEWFGPAVAENIAYILGGTLIFILGFLAMPWTDLDIRWMKAQMAKMRRGRRRSRKED